MNFDTMKMLVGGGSVLVGLQPLTFHFFLLTSHFSRPGYVCF